MFRAGIISNKPSFANIASRVEGTWSDCFLRAASTKEIEGKEHLHPQKTTVTSRNPLLNLKGQWSSNCQLAGWNISFREGDSSASTISIINYQFLPTTWVSDVAEKGKRTDSLQFCEAFAQFLHAVDFILLAESTYTQQKKQKTRMQTATYSAQPLTHQRNFTGHLFWSAENYQHHNKALDFIAVSSVTKRRRPGLFT